MCKRRWVLLIVLMFVLIAGCQSAASETIVVTEIMEVTRIVEVTPEAPAEEEGVEALSVFPSLQVDVLNYRSMNGREYVVYVALPMTYAFTDQEYPVVYVTDGDFYTLPLAMAAGQLAFGQEIPEVIVVGIGYGGDAMNSLQLRELDMTVEGTDSFLQFIKEELIPDIEADYRVTSSPRTLVGHSLGGAFTLYSTFKASDTFDNFIASSPSCLGGCQEIEAAYATDLSELDVRLFASTGELDPEVTEPLENFWAALQAREYEAFDGEMVILDDETHLSARPRAFNTGLRWIFTQGE